jgi:hypothetical protein
VEVTIERPAGDVWPHFVGDKKNVWTKSDYTTVAGEPGKLGEIYTHAHRVHGVQAFYETIRVTPERHLVLKITCRENDNDELRLMGYDFVTLKEENGWTTVTFQQGLVLPVAAAESNLRRKTEQQDQRLVELFGNLKAIVEDSR